MLNWFNRTSTDTGRQSDSKGPSFLEALEPRVLLSATLEGGVLDIVGDAADNAIVIEVGAADGQVVLTGVPDVADGTSFDGVTAINILGGDGDDKITIDAEVGAAVSVDGEAGDDTLVVEGSDTEGDSINVSQGKHDQSGLVLVEQPGSLDVNAGGVEGLTINGNGGDDQIKINRLQQTELLESGINILGGDGNDTITIDAEVGAAVSVDGEAGDDTLVIEGSDTEGDSIKVSQGKRDKPGLVLVEQPGSLDVNAGGVEGLTINGNGGDDRIKISRLQQTELLEFGININGGDGDDRLVGSKTGRALVLNGDDGDDRLAGGDKGDILDGGIGNDRLRGNAGADLLFGGAGQDRLFGGNGNDQLIGNSGVDRLIGGRGRDTADYSDSPSSVVVSLRDRRALLDGYGYEDRVVKGVEDLVGSNSADALEGDRRANRIFGGTGGDILDGLDGDDILDAGPDTHADELDGGLGRTIFFNCGMEDSCIPEDGTGSA